MGIDIDKEEFSKLPQKGMLMVLFENTQKIHKRLDMIDYKQNNHENNNKITIYSGFIWLFLITVYLGLKKYLPFL